MSFIIALKASFHWWNSVGSPLKVSVWHLGKLCLDSNKFPLGALTPKRPRQGSVMGRSEPGGEKKRQLARNATKVIAAEGGGDAELATGDRLTKRD